MGSVYVRDALLDPNPATADDYRRQLEETYRAADEALQQYVPVVDSPAEHERIARLRREIDEFRQHDARGARHRQPPLAGRSARLCCAPQIMPKREGVIRVSEEVQALNRSAFVQQQRDIAALYRAHAAPRLADPRPRARRQPRHRAARHALCRPAREPHPAPAAARRRERARSAAAVRQADHRAGRGAAQHRARAARRSRPGADRDQSRAGGRAALDRGRRRRRRTRSRTRGRSPTARCTPCAICRTCSIRRCSTTSACRRRSTGTCEGFGRRHGVRIELLQDRMDERLHARNRGRRLPDRPGGADQRRQARAGDRPAASTCSGCRNTLLVTIEDDGVGFDPTDGAAAGRAARPRPGRHPRARVAAARHSCGSRARRARARG